jgi:hypothetical protein
MANVAKAMVSRVVEKRNLNEVVALLKMQIESLAGHGKPLFGQSQVVANPMGELASTIR